MKSKQLWIEQFLDDEEIFKYFQEFVKMAEFAILELEHCITLENKNETAKKEKLTRSAISSVLNITACNKRILRGLVNREFLSAYQAEEYDQKLENVMNRARQITIRENLI